MEVTASWKENLASCLPRSFVMDSPGPDLKKTKLSFSGSWDWKGCEKRRAPGGSQLELSGIYLAVIEISHIGAGV